MADLNQALAELDEWAGHTAHSDATPTQPDHTDTNEGDTPCLQQHQISALLRLARSIKGAPLPASALPVIPR